jgi:protein-S-isoprenylcysteine O-methyltransferase Ste14
MNDVSAYGLWPLVIINSLIFIIFAFSFTKPKTATDWRSLGAFSAFIVALFTEMYGVPLTIYLIIGWLGSKYSGLNLSHDSGHLWYSLFGLTGDPHLSIFHLISNFFIFGGIAIIVLSWNVLHKSQKNHELATEGPYAYILHPQYTAFMLIMVGFLIQWPTIPTLIMFPILVLIYKKLAFKEEKDVTEEFGKQYSEYASNKPRFIPNIIRKVKLYFRTNT